MKLENIVDTKKYPIHELQNLKIKKLIKKCRKELDEFSCCTIPNFILKKSIKSMLEDLKDKLDKVYWS